MPNLPLESTCQSSPREAPSVGGFQASEARNMQHLSTAGPQRGPLSGRETALPRGARFGPVEPESTVIYPPTRWDPTTEHLSYHHRDPRQSRLVCPICGCVFAGEAPDGSLARHIEVLHVVGLAGRSKYSLFTGPFQCCRRDFTASTEAAVRAHIVEEHALPEGLAAAPARVAREEKRPPEMDDEPMTSLKKEKFI